MPTEQNQISAALLGGLKLLKLGVFLQMMLTPTPASMTRLEFMSNVRFPMCLLPTQSISRETILLSQIVQAMYTVGRTQMLTKSMVDFIFVEP